MDLDELFAEDDAGTLSVPALDSDAVNEIAIADGDMDNDIAYTEDSSAAQTGKPGTTVTCEICGRKARVKRDGFLGAHGKCEPKPQRGNRLETLPERRSPMKSRTRDFAIGVLSWGIEEVSAQAIARPFNVDPDDVPTDLPDADVMIGVPLDMVWPEIPDAAQKFIEKLADNSDVIEAGMAWFEWMRTIGKWTRTQREIQRQLSEATNGSSVATGTAVTGGQLLPFIPAEG